MHSIILHFAENQMIWEQITAHMSDYIVNLRKDADLYSRKLLMA